MKRKIFIALGIIVAGFVLINIFGSKKQDEPQPSVIPGALISEAKKVKLGKITDKAEIIYHFEKYVYTMDRNGESVTRITFENPRAWEHVAVSFDHRFIVGNEQLPNPEGAPGGHSRLWLFDLVNGTEAQLLSGFDTAGNGGVEWDGDGFIYFAAKEKDVVQNAVKPADLLKNAGANDIYKVKFDGTGLKRLTNTPDKGEADVSVSKDGTLISSASTIISINDTIRDNSEILVARSDGSNLRAVYEAGKNRISSVHDPEISPENKKVIFSKVNSDVTPNFAENADANTAHDLWIVNMDGSNLTRLTQIGPISIVPDWKDDIVVYFEASEKDNYIGASVINIDGSGHKRIKMGAGLPKWIP